MPGSLACIPICHPSKSPLVPVFASEKMGCAGVPGVSPDLSPFITASCPVFYFWETGVCRETVPGSLACLLSCLPSDLPLVLCSIAGEPECAAGGVPGLLACLPI